VSADGANQKLTRIGSTLVGTEEGRCGITTVTTAGNLAEITVEIMVKEWAATMALNRALVKDRVAALALSTAVVMDGILVRITGKIMAAVTDQNSVAALVEVMAKGMAVLARAMVKDKEWAAAMAQSMVVMVKGMAAALDKTLVKDKAVVTVLNMVVAMAKVWVAAMAQSMVDTVKTMAVTLASVGGLADATAVSVRVDTAAPMTGLKKTLMIA
jgi:hypothetical protein